MRNLLFFSLLLIFVISYFSSTMKSHASTLHLILPWAAYDDEKEGVCQETRSAAAIPKNNNSSTSIQKQEASRKKGTIIVVRVHLKGAWNHKLSGQLLMSVDGQKQPNILKININSSTSLWWRRCWWMERTAHTLLIQCFLLTAHTHTHTHTHTFFITLQWL